MSCRFRNFCHSLFKHCLKVNKLSIHDLPARKPFCSQILYLVFNYYFDDLSIEMWNGVVGLNPLYCVHISLPTFLCKFGVFNCEESCYPLRKQVKMYAISFRRSAGQFLNNSIGRPLGPFARPFLIVLKAFFISSTETAVICKRLSSWVLFIGSSQIQPLSYDAWHF